MNCSRCQHNMPLIRGQLRYTILDTMQAVLLTNCEYFYCERCDTVRYSADTEAYILRKIEEATGDKKIIINF